MCFAPKVITFPTQARGSKQYELTDHLGNIRTVVPDIKEQPETADVANAGTLFGTFLPLNRLTDNDNFRLPTLTLNNYYPYGMLQAGRSRNAGGYRFGFQGQEADNKIGGLGQHTTAQFWEYDTWAVKRWNMDPETLAWESPYATFRNNPVLYKDPNGDCPICFLAKGATGAAVDATVQFLVNVVIYNGDYGAAIKNIDYKSVAWEGLLSANPFHVSKAQRVGLSVVGDLSINYLDGSYDKLEGNALYEQLFFDALKSGATTLIAERLGNAGMKKLGSFLETRGWTPKDIFKATGEVRYKTPSKIFQARIIDGEMVPTSKNGWAPDFSGTSFIKAEVKIKLTGKYFGTEGDFALANAKAGFKGSAAPKIGGVQYTWHHMDDFDPKTGMGTMQLVPQSTHRATTTGSGHSGGAEQYHQMTGEKYKPF